jgi:hypothetical protein
MTTGTVKGLLRVAIFGAAVCLLPAMVSADCGARSSSDNAARGVPDHAQAEARRGSERRPPTVDKINGTLDHNQAESRGGAATIIPIEERTGIPDHAEAESRGADSTR